MKKFFKILGHLILLTIVFSIALTVYSLVSPDTDESLTQILNNYAIVKESSRSAYIVNTGVDPKTPVIESIVISYATSSGYIAVRQTDVPEDENTKPDFTTYCYWLIDTSSNRIYGPLATDDDFAAKCQELQLQFGEWLGA